MNGPQPWPVRKFRDLTIIQSPDKSNIVIACDSVGGIGSKPQDTVQTPARTATHFGARVPILEVLACGALPTVIVNTLGVERDPSAVEMIDEVRSLAVELGLDPDVAVTGSTEDNVPTVATGFGVTVIGTRDGELSIGTTLPYDEIYSVGVPLSAPAHILVPGDPRMPSIAEALLLARLDGVHEILPVGSRGIDYEISELVSSAGLAATPAGPNTIDRVSTAGPSTVLLVSISPAHAASLLTIRPDLPVELVARAVQTNPQPSTNERQHHEHQPS
ncbi:hypothetical protein [Arthrobacter sp. Soil762]|uniref:hypothetical protein n=1 Tax=Arthrobacter sp. Soil762 TaxID=1736401 RepID=UPI0006FDC0D4|nr:hypothetical protein [Arthrobacter sp. Soil762]KRE72684.1 hypothetical protein ASG77_08445 [Arthrobacter sp. Soil762]